MAKYGQWGGEGAGGLRSGSAEMRFPARSGEGHISKAACKETRADTTPARPRSRNSRTLPRVPGSTLPAGTGTLRPQTQCQPSESQILTLRCQLASFLCSHPSF